MDPESLYDDIVSARPERIRADAEALGDASREVDEASRGVVDGMTGVRWPEGLAGIAFRYAGQQHFADTQMAAWRMFRCGSVLDQVAESYGSVRDSAEDVIRAWRAQPEAHHLLWVRVSFLLALSGLKSSWSSTLSEAASGLTRGDESIPAQEDWARNGAEKSFINHVETGSNLGVRIPRSVLNSGEHQVQQGLAHDPVSQSWLLSSYEHEDPTDYDSPKLSHLSFIDTGTGEESRSVGLTSPSGAYVPQHSGGVAVQGGKAYVVSSEPGGSYVYEYSMRELRQAGDGDTIHAERRVEMPMEASSYVSTAEGKLWLGNWVDPDEADEGQLYAVTPDLLDAWADKSSTYVPPAISTPAGVNGAAVSPGGITYSVNQGRDMPSELVTHTRTGDQTGSLELGSLAEESEEVGNVLTSLSEAGAYKFDPTDPTTDDPDDLWAQTHLTDIPSGSLDGSIDVEPQSLRRAAGTFDDVRSLLSSVHGTVLGIDVPADVFGDVDGAASLASAVNEQVHTATTELAATRDRAGEIDHGLRYAADGYEITDLESFRALGSGTFSLS